MGNVFAQLFDLGGFQSQLGFGEVTHHRHTLSFFGAPILLQFGYFVQA